MCQEDCAKSSVDKGRTVPQTRKPIHLFQLKTIRIVMTEVLTATMTRQKSSLTCFWPEAASPPILSFARIAHHHSFLSLQRRKNGFSCLCLTSGLRVFNRPSVSAPDFFLESEHPLNISQSFPQHTQAFHEGRLGERKVALSVLCFLESALTLKSGAAGHSKQLPPPHLRPAH